MFPDRGYLVATSSNDGPPPYSSKVMVAAPVRGPWRTVYSSDALYNAPTLSDGFLAFYEYREQGGGAFSEKLVVVDLPFGRPQVVDSYALSAAPYRGGGGGPPRPTGSAVMGGGLIAWVRLVEGSGGAVTGQLRIGLPHQATQARLIDTSDVSIHPIAIDVQATRTTLVYSIARGGSVELRAREIDSGADRVLATAPLGAPGSTMPFQAVARSGEWVAWVDETAPAAGATFARSTLRAVSIATGTTRTRSLDDSSCPVLTGNPRYFALDCIGPGTAGPRLVLIDAATWTDVPVARPTSDGPFALEAKGLLELLWQDRMNGLRRAVLFTPTPDARSISPAASLATFENAGLGYRVGLPTTYRRAVSNVTAEGVGQDFYSPRGEDADRALCEREKGSHLPSFERAADVKVEVQKSNGMSAADYASARPILFTAVEELTIDGHDAARVVQIPSGDTAYYVVRANDRLYEIAPLAFSQPSAGNAGGAGEPPPVGWLDQIALSFRATTPQVPAGTPSPALSLCGG